MERRRLHLTGVGSRITRASDVLIPVVLAGMSLTEIWIERFAQPGFHGPRGVQTLGALLMTVSLGWRRRYPVAVLAGVTPAPAAGGRCAAVLAGRPALEPDPRRHRRADRPYSA